MTKRTKAQSPNPRPSSRKAGDQLQPVRHGGEIVGWVAPPTSSPENDPLRPAKYRPSDLSDRIIKGGRADEDDASSVRLDAARRSLIEAFGTIAKFNRLTEVEQAQLADDLASRFGAAPPGQVGVSRPLPRKAPALWSDRDQTLKLNPVEFTRMTYGPWLGRGLTRSILRELDKALYHAVANWISRHPDDAIPELPSQSEQIDQKLERLASEFTPDELRRLGLALQARMQRSVK